MVVRAVKQAGEAPNIVLNSVDASGNGSVVKEDGGVIIVGYFKRGIVGKVFKVTSKNFAKRLGYDPQNPSYLAVHEAFDKGINSVEVCRLRGTLSPT